MTNIKKEKEAQLRKTKDKEYLHLANIAGIKLDEPRELFDVIVGNSCRENEEIKKVKYWLKLMDEAEQRYLIKRSICDKALIYLLCFSDFVDVKITVSRSPDSPQEVLRYLSNDKSKSIKCFVLSNPNTPLDCIDGYIDGEESYKLSIVRNLNLPTDYLDKLSANSSLRVLEYIAGHLNTAEDTLMRLYNRYGKELRYILMENKNITEELFLMLCARDDMRETAHDAYKEKYGKNWND